MNATDAELNQLVTMSAATGDAKTALMADLLVRLSAAHERRAQMDKSMKTDMAQFR